MIHGLPGKIFLRDMSIRYIIKKGANSLAFKSPACSNVFIRFSKKVAFLGKSNPSAKLNYPQPIVIATPNENPSRTEIGISVQYFSNFKRKARKEKTPAPMATIGMISTP
jgi:hypothetical protein